MKATLEFDLDISADSMAHFRCIKSTDMALALFNIKNNIEQKCKAYLSINPDATNNDLLDKVIEEIHNVLSDKDINIDELIN
jgi:hypothetical protein